MWWELKADFNVKAGENPCKYLYSFLIKPHSFMKTGKAPAVIFVGSCGTISSESGISEAYFIAFTTYGLPR